MHWIVAHFIRSLPVALLLLTGPLQPAIAQCIGFGPVVGPMRQNISGEPGEIAIPPAKAYHVSASAPTTYTVQSNVSWITVAPTTGELTLPTLSNDPAFSVTLNSGVQSLPLGVHQATVSVTGSCPNTNVSSAVVVEIIVQVPGTIQVSPAIAFDVTGVQGGPFPTGSYTVTNVGFGTGNNLIWSGSSSQPWVTLSDGTGGIVPGASTTTNVVFTTAANSLPVGQHTATISFNNNTNPGRGNTTRNVVLNVRPAGSLSELVAAVLPQFRSVQIGTTATAFATIINAGATTRTGCRPRMPGTTLTTIPATFEFRATDAANNFIAPLNEPMTVPPSGVQSYVFAITPGGTMASQQLNMVFICDDTLPASTIPGVNSFTLSAAATPTPDMIAIAATPGNDGIVSIPFAGGGASSGLFAAAVINIGAGGTINASVDDNGRGLSLTPTLCQTNPSTGACVNPPSPAPTVSFSSATNATATFTIFANGTGTIPFDPATNRLFLRFKTPDNVTRGATSVAVRKVP